MSKCTRLTDRRTDRRTDGQTEFPSLYRDCIPCSAVKTTLPMLMQNIRPEQCRTQWAFFPRSYNCWWHSQMRRSCLQTVAVNITVTSCNSLPKLSNWCRYKLATNAQNFTEIHLQKVWKWAAFLIQSEHTKIPTDSQQKHYQDTLKLVTTINFYSTIGSWDTEAAVLSCKHSRTGMFSAAWCNTQLQHADNNHLELEARSREIKRLF